MLSRSHSAEVPDTEPSTLQLAMQLPHDTRPPTPELVRLNWEKTATLHRMLDRPAEAPGKNC